MNRGGHSFLTVPADIAGAVLLCWLPACAAHAQPSRPAPNLEPGTTVERKFAPPEIHSYPVRLAAGQSLHIVIHQTRTELAARLQGPAGNTLTESRDWEGDWNEFPISMIAAATGTYRLELRAADKDTPAGSYRMEVTALRAATPEDSKRASAVRDFVEAERLNADGAVESLQLALKKYQAVLPVWHALGDRRNEAKTLYSTGLIYWKTGEPQKTIDLSNQGLALWRALGDKSGEGATLSAIGSTYFQGLNEPQKALDYDEKALSLLHQAGARNHEAQTLNNMGQVYMHLGEVQKALDYMGRALPLHREEGDRMGEAIVLHNMGLICEHVDERQKALDYLSASLALHRQASARQGEIHVLNAMAIVYRDLGETQRSVDYLNQAMALRPADPNLQAELLDNLGSAYGLMHEQRRALEYFQRALPLLRKTGDRIGQALTLDDIAVSYMRLGEIRQALDYFQQALTLRRAVKDRVGEAHTLFGIGEAYTLLGNSGDNIEKALQHLNRAVQILKETGDRGSRAYTLYLAARAERSRGHLEDALKLVGQAIELNESVRSNVSGDTLRASFLETVRFQYELKIALLVALHREVEAFEASELGRARSLLELLRESQVDFRQGVDPVLLAKERSLHLRLRAKATRQVQMLSDKHTDAQAAAAEKEINNLTLEYEQVEAEIREKSPAYAALTQPRTLHAAEIQKQVLDPNTLLLEYVLGHEESFLWAITPASLSTYKLPKSSELDAAARRAYQAFSTAGSTDNQALMALGRIVLGPVSAQLGTKRVVVVADGALHFVPFAALPAPGTGKPLIVEHEVVSLPSASTLAEQRRALAGRRTAPRAVAVLADPVFDGADPRISGAKTTVRPIELLTRSAAETGFGGFPRLSASRREAEEIAALSQPGKSLKALDFEASRATATGDDLRQYRIIHFATHGLLNAQHPELSGIVLSLVNRKGEPENGFVQAHEMYNLKLGADLVVMSACQTALGKEVLGEGLVGMTRGLMYAGAARVVASLWRVPDLATAELMKRFYKGMLVDGLRPAAALRQAQVSIWQDGRWARPYYWAAFTMQGDWR